ncbi:MAG: hypothetical protein AB1714_20115 [Acidobacteriota bacterium]
MFSQGPDHTVNSSGTATATHTTQHGRGGDGGSWWRLPTDDICEALRPLLCRLRLYDALRRKLEVQGGRLGDIARLTAHLTEETQIKVRWGTYNVSLANPLALRAMLSEVGYYEVHFQVRSLDTQMPVYYICRTLHDYWFEYSLIVEDLYLSPGYPMHDERFVKLMRHGHETFHLRLSQLRDRVALLTRSDKEGLADRVDQILCDVGRHVLQAAWHEDQQLAFLAAAHLELVRCRHAIELLYLCLNGELCELRGIVTQTIERFFDEVYPQPAIAMFLQRLPRLDGSALNALPREAQRLYVKLCKAFGRFLRTEVRWGWRNTAVPIHKLLFANVPRLELVGNALKGTPAVAEAVAHIEEVAAGVISDIANIG